MSVLARYGPVDPVERIATIALVVLGAIGFGAMVCIGWRLAKDQWRPPKRGEAIIAVVGLTLGVFGYGALMALLGD